MSLKLFIEAILKFMFGVLLVGVLIFVPAGSMNYWNGWLLMILLFIPMFIAGVIMMINSPELLKSRLNAREKESEQKEVLALSAVMFILGFVLAGFNYRFGWVDMPLWIVILSAILFLVSYVIYAEVLRENAFLSRTIEVKENQKLIDTGLYNIVRHPMYTATIMLFLSIPLILGSIISFIVFLAYPLIIVKRINNEEEVMEKELVGYSKYKGKVKYKLIPYVW